MKILKNSTYNKIQNEIKTLKEVEANRILAIKQKTANFQKLLADKDAELLKLQNENELLKWALENPAKFKKADVIGKYKIINVKVQEATLIKWVSKGLLNLLNEGIDFAISNAKPFVKYYYEYSVWELNKKFAKMSDAEIKQQEVLGFKKLIILKTEKELIELQESSKNKKKK